MTLALLFSFLPNIVVYFRSGVFSLVKTIDIFWLVTVIYALEFRQILSRKRSGDESDDPLSELFGMFFPWRLSLRSLIWALLVPYFVFLFPDLFLMGFETQLTVVTYSRVVIFFGLYIGLASGAAYLLGWKAPLRIKRDDPSTNVLTNTFSALSILSAFLIVITFSSGPSDLWRNYAPAQFSTQDVVTVFNTFTRHLIEMSAVSLGLSFFVVGKLFAMISDERNRRELSALGLVFSVITGSLLGYIVGPTLFFVVIEIPFIVGCMIGIGALLHLLASSNR